VGAAQRDRAGAGLGQATAGVCGGGHGAERRLRRVAAADQFCGWRRGITSARTRDNNAGDGSIGHSRISRRTAAAAAGDDDVGRHDIARANGRNRNRSHAVARRSGKILSDGDGITVVIDRRAAAVNEAFDTAPPPNSTPLVLPSIKVPPLKLTVDTPAAVAIWSTSNVPPLRFSVATFNVLP